jgi:hypothetical protein
MSHPIGINSELTVPRSEMIATENAEAAMLHDLTLLIV